MRKQIKTQSEDEQTNKNKAKKKGGKNPATTKTVINRNILSIYQSVRDSSSN